MLEEASDPAVILKQIRRLRWAYNNGYRPVPGYTVAEKHGDGRIYLAIELEKS